MKNKKLYIIISLIAYCTFLGTGLFSEYPLPGDVIDSLEIEVNGINTYDALYPNLVIRFNEKECTFISKEQIETDSYYDEILNVDSIRTRTITELINTMFISKTVPIYSSYKELRKRDNREVDYVPLDWLFVRFYRHNLLLLGCKREEGKNNIVVGDVNTREEQILYDNQIVIYSEAFKKFMENIYEIMDGMNSTLSDNYNSNDETIYTSSLESIIDSLDRWE